MIPAGANPRRIYVSQAHNAAAFAARRRAAEGRALRRRKPPGIDEVEWLLQNRRIDPITGCWEWTGARFNGRYGMVRYKGSYVGAHRVMWLETCGPIPDSLGVLHTCDNPPCFNPAHLWLGTPKDNSDDKVAKGRGKAPHSDAHPRTRLTAEQVRAIRADTRSDSVIARDYAVAATTVWNIQARRTWKHLA